MLKTLALAATAGLACSAQAGIIDSAVVIAKALDVAPGTSGWFYAGSNSIGQVSVDGTGRVYYVGTLFSSGSVGALNRAGVWSGTTAADNALVVRDGDQVQGMAAGVIFNTSASAGGLGPSLSSRPTADGGMFGGQMTGPGMTAGVNDQGLFVGTASGYSIVARRGDAAAGTAGATYNSTYKSYSQQTNAINRNGTLALQTALAGGDVSGTTNNAGVYVGTAGSLALAARKGESVGGGVTISTLDFNVKLDSADNAYFDVGLAGAGVDSTNNSAWFSYNAGSGKSMIYREGTVAAGTAGATFSGQASTGARSYSTAGLLFTGTLIGGDVSGTTNNTGLFRARLGGTDLIARRGVSAAGTDGTFDSFNSSTLSMTNSGRIGFQGSIIGGTSTTANDTGYWAGSTNGNDLTLIAREGEIAFGTAGAIFASFSGATFAMNELGQILFTGGLSGGDVSGTTNNSAFYVWDHSAGLQMVLRKGDSFTVAPGDVRTISSWTIQGGDNANGGCLGWNSDGVVGMRLVFTDNTDAVIRMTNVPTPGSFALFAGGLALATRRRRSR